MPQNHSGEGAHGGHVIGHTRSGKPIYASTQHVNHAPNDIKRAHPSYSKHDHIDAAAAHADEAARTPDRGIRADSHTLAQAHASAALSMRKPKDTDLSPLDPPDLVKAEGSRGGKVVGHYPSGRTKYARNSHGSSAKPKSTASVASSQASKDKPKQVQADAIKQDVDGPNRVSREDMHDMVKDAYKLRQGTSGDYGGDSEDGDEDYDDHERRFDNETYPAAREVQLRRAANMAHNHYPGWTAVDHNRAVSLHWAGSDDSSKSREARGEHIDRAEMHDEMAMGLRHMSQEQAKKSTRKNDLGAARLHKGASDGSRGGHVIGHTKTGKPIYQSSRGPSGGLSHIGVRGYTAGDHADAIAAHTALASTGLPAEHAEGARRAIAYHQKKSGQAPTPTPPAGIQSAIAHPGTPLPAAAPKAAAQNPTRALTSLSRRIDGIKTDEAAISSGQYRKDKKALEGHALKVHDQHFSHMSAEAHMAAAQAPSAGKKGAAWERARAQRGAHAMMAHALMTRQRSTAAPVGAPSAAVIHGLPPRAHPAQAMAKSTTAQDLCCDGTVAVETPAEAMKLVNRLVQNMRRSGLEVEVEGTPDGGYFIRRRLGGEPVEIRPDGVLRAPAALVMFALGDDLALAKAGIAMPAMPAVPKPPSIPKPPAMPAMPKLAVPKAPAAAAPHPPGNAVLGKTTSGGTIWAHAKADSPVYRAFGPRDHAQAANMHQLSGNHAAAGEHRAMHAKMTAPKAPAMSAGALAARPRMGAGRLARSHQKEADMVKWESQDVLGDWLGKAEGSRGGHIIGHTRSGKPIYSADSVKYRHIGEGSPERYQRHVNAMKRGYRLFTPEDHEDAISAHDEVEEGHQAAISKLRSDAAKRGWADTHWEEMPHHEAAMQSRAAITGHSAAIEDAKESAYNDKLKEIFGKSDHGDHRMLAKTEGARGGQVIGHTASGKPIYASLHGNNYPKFSMGEHGEAAQVHAAAAFAAHKAGDAEGAKAHGAMRFTHVQAAMRMSNAPRVVTGPNTGAPPVRKPRAPKVKAPPATQAEA